MDLNAASDGGFVGDETRVLEGRVIRSGDNDVDDRIRLCGGGGVCLGGGDGFCSGGHFYFDGATGGDDGGTPEVFGVGCFARVESVAVCVAAVEWAVGFPLGEEAGKGACR